MRVLVTGGAGYIGSGMVRELIQAGCEPLVFDNLSTGHRSFVPKSIRFIRGDLRNTAELREVFKKEKIDAVMHFAALCLVGESVKYPLAYYENNVLGGVNLLKAMVESRVRRFIFSSSCAVYGQPKRVPIRESAPANPANPYGETKWMFEKILKDLACRGDIAYIALRYFNACGAHASGEIGERHDPETHLIPNILKVLTGEKKTLMIFGNDYPTPDGTCIRDYVHVEDLTRAHLAALKALNRGIKNEAFNLGMGKGYSVKEIIETAERITGQTVRCVVCRPRLGDPARLVADATRARKLLGWKPVLGLEEIIHSAWRWERKSAKRSLGELKTR